MKKIYLALIAILSTLFLFYNPSVSASHFTGVADTIETVTKSDIISEYAQSLGISYTEAQTRLFPEEQFYAFRSTLNTNTTYVRMSSEVLSYPTLYGHVPNNAGHVYFYCETSTGGWFRGIKRIIYAGYYSGTLSFAGNFQYHLQNANTIHYTLNGHLYNFTTSGQTIGGSVGQDGVASLNISVESSSNYYGPLYYHGNRYY